MNGKRQRASRYIYKKYEVEGWINGFGGVSLSKIQELKKSLVSDHSFQELGSLKSALSSQLDFLKLVNLIVLVVTFFITSIVNVTSFFNQQQMKIADWTHSANIMMATEYIKDLNNKEEKAEVIKQSLLKDIESYQNMLQKNYDEYIYQLWIILVVLGVIFFYYLLRYMWLSDISSCASEAYEEKKRVEDSEKKRLQAFEKLISITSTPNKVGIHDNNR